MTDESLPGRLQINIGKLPAWVKTKCPWGMIPLLCSSPVQSCESEFCHRHRVQLYQSTMESASKLDGRCWFCGTREGNSWRDVGPERLRTYSCRRCGDRLLGLPHVKEEDKVTAH
jgi:hypothetical protein